MSNLPDLVRIAAEYRGSDYHPQYTHFYLTTTLLELNGTSIEHLCSPPSPLQFSRLVNISRPALIKGCTHIEYSKWTNPFLSHVMGSRQFSVAVTPYGQGADALVTGEDGETYFVEPHVEKMRMETFLSRLNSQREEEVYYLQSQNGNLYPSSPSEYEPLLLDVPKDIDWATEAFGRSPDAVNLWIGDNLSVTSVHSDPYENIYTVVRGTKHFTLFPPTEAHTLKEKTYKHACYKRTTPSSPLSLCPSPSGVVRWSSLLDPSLPNSVPGASPLHISVHAGETLYLPPGWWHHVRQTGDDTGVCIAINWWYDMEMRGMHWVWLQYLRGTIFDGDDDK